MFKPQGFHRISQKSWPRPSWWLGFNPTHLKNMHSRQNGFIFPNFSGWTFAKYWSCHHLEGFMKGVTRAFSISFCSSFFNHGGLAYGLCWARGMKHESLAGQSNKLAFNPILSRIQSTGWWVGCYMLNFSTSKHIWKPQLTTSLPSCTKTRSRPSFS